MRGLSVYMSFQNKHHFDFRGFADSILECKECDAKTVVHPECLPIPIPQGDPFYPPINITTGRPFCLAFTRCSKNEKNRAISRNFLFKKCGKNLAKKFNLPQSFFG